jgi:hypothetical protein
LKLLQKVAEHYHVAIIGSTGSPKQKSKDRYIGLRDQVIGTSVWGRKTETIVVLQKENGKETDDVTIMTVLPRNDKPEVFNLVWDRGRFRVSGRRRFSNRKIKQRPTTCSNGSWAARRSPEPKPVRRSVRCPVRHSQIDWRL